MRQHKLSDDAGENEGPGHMTGRTFGSRESTGIARVLCFVGHL